MVSGSSVGNTVTTGSVTIPMMKKTGYRPEFAGAVEAASSTGGQIMPPIMGAAAFLMAEYMGIPYIQVATIAIIPAILYFTGIFWTVHLEAKKRGLKGIPIKDLPIDFHKVYLISRRETHSKVVDDFISFMGAYRFPNSLELGQIKIIKTSNNIIQEYQKSLVMVCSFEFNAELHTISC